MFRPRKSAVWHILPNQDVNNAASSTSEYFQQVAVLKRISISFEFYNYSSENVNPVLPGAACNVACDLLKSICVILTLHAKVNWGLATLHNQIGRWVGRHVCKINVAFHQWYSHTIWLAHRIISLTILSFTICGWQEKHFNNWLLCTFTDVLPWLIYGCDHLRTWLAICLA